MNANDAYGGRRYGCEGFTLIELMIVVAIIAILSSIAMASYREYVVQARVSEGFSLASSLQSAVADYWTINGSFLSDWPSTDPTCTSANEACTKAYGVEKPSGSYSIDAMIGYGGTIIITYNQLLDPGAPGYTLVLRPNFKGGSLGWECFSKDSPPTKNGVTVTGYAAPSLPSKYAPPSCR